MTAKIFEDFDPPTKNFLAAPLVTLAIEIEWQLHFYKSEIHTNMMTSPMKIFYQGAFQFLRFYGDG